MGMFNFFSSSNHRPSPPTYDYTPPKPQQKVKKPEFKILRYYPRPPYLAIQVQYIGVEYYEGVKTLVYANTTIEEVQSWEWIDPHFSSVRPDLSPIARFLPTPGGWRMAVDMCRDLSPRTIKE